MKMLSKNNALAVAALITAAALPLTAQAEIQLVEKDDLKLYIGLETEAKFVFESLDTDEQTSDDYWDNKAIFGFGGTIGSDWSFATSLEFTDLSDDANSKVGNASEAEVKDAWLQYKNGYMVRGGRWTVGLGSHLFYEETTTGAMFGTNLGEAAVQVGVGTDSEGGEMFANDKTLFWAQAKMGSFYVFNALHSDHDGALGDLWNLGVGYKGKLGGLKTLLEGNMQYGQDGADRDYSGYALLGAVSFPLGGMEPKLIVGYGSGDDNGADDERNDFVEQEGDFKPDVVIINELNGESLSNLMVVQISNEFEMSDRWSLTPKLGWYQLAEDDANGNTDVGVELDLESEWAFNKYVGAFVNVGYVFSGDAISAVAGGAGDEDLYRVEVGAVVEF